MTFTDFKITKTEEKCGTRYVTVEATHLPSGRPAFATLCNPANPAAAFQRARSKFDRLIQPSTAA